MSWKTRYLTGSFRGAAFHLRSADGEEGQRTVLHQFPLRDEGYVEDLGKKDLTITFQAYVVGPEYQAARDALIDACRQGGSGELHHPYLGVKTVTCTGLRWRETIEDGGLCTFDLSFVQTSPRTYPEAVADTASVAATASTTALSISVTAFGAALSIASATERIYDAAQTVIGTVVTAIGATATLIGAGNLIASWLSDAAGLLGADATQMRDRDQVAAVQAQTVASLPGLLAAAASASAATATASNEALGSQIAGSIGLVTALSGTLPAAWTAQLSLTAFDVAAVEASTPTRQWQASNQAAVVDLVRQAALVEAARIATVFPFETADQALAMRDRLAEAIDAATASAPDAVYLAFSDLRRAATAEILRRGVNLARIVTTTPAHTEPALVTAYRLHGSIAGADDIVSRNRLTHPGFVPGGTALKTLSKVAS